MIGKICKHCEFCVDFRVVYHVITAEIILHGKDNNTICSYKFNTDKNSYYDRYGLRVNRKWLKKNIRNLTYLEEQNKFSCPHHIEHLML